MRVSVLKKGVPVAVATAMFALAGAPQADAGMPWWHLSTISGPAGQQGGEGTIIVDASNLGDAWVNGCLEVAPGTGKYTDPHCAQPGTGYFEEGTPVTIVDNLPAGVTVTAVHQGGENYTVNGQAINGEELNEEPRLSCSHSGQTVMCTFSRGHLLAYEHLLIAIRVRVAPGSGHGINEVSVSGGGVPSLVSHRALALSDSPSLFGVENYEMTAEEEGGAPSTQAGSHPFQLTTTLDLNTQTVLAEEFAEPLHKREPKLEPVGPFTKDLHFNLPPGLVGNPTPLSKCSLRVFLEETSSPVKCPTDTVVGVATPILAWGDNVQALNSSPTQIGEITEPLFMLEPTVGEPARFGFQSPAGPILLDTSVRTGGDYAVVVSVSDITQAAMFIGSQVTFWGVPSDPRHDTTRGPTCLAHLESTGTIFEPGPEVEKHCPVQEQPQPFLIMPTSCTGPLRTSVEADPWAQPGQFTPPKEYAFANSAGEPIGQDGCNLLNFHPSIGVSPDGRQASSPTGLTVEVHVPQDASLDPTGLAESTVKDTSVTLPAGVALNPGAADGLLSCGLGEIGLESSSEQTCPEAAKVATVEIKTPLLPNPLLGAVYLAAQNANPFGSLVALYIVARDPVSGVLIKLAGQVTPDPTTGQLTSTFKNTPQLPFEDLKLYFFGGSRAPLSTPALCGSYTASASIAPWSGNAPAEPSSEFLITSGPNGSPCSNPLPFNPSLTTGSLNLQAGAFTPFTMTMSREDGNQDLDAVQLRMPPGLLGTLSNVKLCGEAQANAGSCSPESLIGHTVVSVGLGGNPFTVKSGEVFITGPYRGAPYGLSIVNPAKAGPFDLGHVIVRAKIEVDPITAALTIISDPTGPHAIPQIIDGIPLQIKHVNVTIDRPHFTFNPTNCSPMSIGGSLTSSQGAVSVLPVPFQVTNCATLRFKPKFSVSTSGHTSRAKGASLDVKLSYPRLPFGSQTNIAKVKVNLPRQLPSRLTTLQKACPSSTFNANPAACPSGSRVGTATASTPIIPVPLSGPVYFVSHGGAKFPELIIVLSGYGTTIQLHGETFISPAGITSSTFRTLPDVPVGSFELKLPQGRDSALAANGNLCKSVLKMPTAFTAQNGAVIHQFTPITVTGCAKHRKRKSARGRRAPVTVSVRSP